MYSKFPGLSELLARLNWHILQVTEIKRQYEVTPDIGAQPATLYRLKLKNEHGENIAAIYKLFADRRSQELDIYEQVYSEVPFLLPILYYVIRLPAEKGILLEDVGESLFPIFKAGTKEEKKNILKGLSTFLAELHIRLAEVSTIWLKKGLIADASSHPKRVWAEKALKELTLLAEQGLIVQQGWTIQEIQKIINFLYLYYSDLTAGPKTCSPGDLHMGNILLCGQDNYRLIDWEWASLALPQQDLATLLKDIWEDELHSFLLSAYQDELLKRGWVFEKDSFIKGFAVYMIEHTLMNFCWDIAKYKNKPSKQKLTSLIITKTRWIKKYYEMIG